MEQVPPPYSAIKIKGRKAYEFAREGEELELQPRIINVYSLEVLEWDPPEAVIDVYCSSGTYVHSLAHDLGNSLGTGAHLVGLRRTNSGRLTLRDAVPLRRLQEAFDAGNWYRFLIPAAEALADWPMVELDADQVELIRHGHRVPVEGDLTGWVHGISQQGDLVALLEADDETKEWPGLNPCGLAPGVEQEPGRRVRNQGHLRERRGCVTHALMIRSTLTMAAGPAAPLNSGTGRNPR